MKAKSITAQLLNHLANPSIGIKPGIKSIGLNKYPIRTFAVKVFVYLHMQALKPLLRILNALPFALAL